VKEGEKREGGGRWIGLGQKGERKGEKGGVGRDSFLTFIFFIFL
jgi:hypothetical protein